MTKYRVFLISHILFLGTSLAVPADVEETTTTAASTVVPSVAASDISSAPPPPSSSDVPTSSVLPEGISASTIAQAAEILARAKDDILLGNGTIPDDGDGIPDEGWEYENTTYVDTRRILYSKTVEKGKRPYMVYLQLTRESAKAHKYRGWLCGGVIVDRYYVLTSAACVEDADRFYIVSGTTKFIDSFDYKNNECVCKHRRKVVWKCIPKNYKFDFQDSIKWSSNDIAIVKVDRPFKFGVLEKGCEFATDLICINNVSRELEKPGTKGFIAGWGSGSNFREGVYRRQNGKVHIPQNAKCLQEAKVCVMDNEQCAKRWAQRFRNIITQYMICTKDVMKRLSELCEKKYANCTDVESGKGRRDAEQYEEPTNEVSTIWNIDLGRHLRDPDDYTARRASNHGGFCENDHGGPLIVKYQNKERVIGVISACKIDPKSHNCHGPFLYTSVFRNRQFISCAINKDVQENCRRVFRTGITHEEWQVSWDGYKEDDDEEVFKQKKALRQRKEVKDNKKVNVKAEDEDGSSSSSEDEEEEVKKPVKVKEVKKEQEVIKKPIELKEAKEEDDEEEIKKPVKTKEVIEEDSKEIKKTVETKEVIEEDSKEIKKPFKPKEVIEDDSKEIKKPVKPKETKKDQVKIKLSVKTKVKKEEEEEDDDEETEETTPKIEKKDVIEIKKIEKNKKRAQIKQKKVEKKKDTKVEAETEDEDESETEVEATTQAKLARTEAVAEVIEPKKIPAEYIDQGNGDKGRDSDKAEVFYESSRDDNVNDPMEE